MSDNDHPLAGPVPDQSKVVINEAYRLRGTILGSYAHVEFLLADLCVRAWELPPYQKFATRFPYKIETRMKSVRKLFEECDGPSHQFLEPAKPLLAELLGYEEERHFMAHGLTTVENHRQHRHVIEIQLWRATAAGADIGIIRWTPERMQHKAEEAAAYCGRSLRLFYDIHDELGWVANRK